MLIGPPPEDLSFTTYWSNDGTSVDGSEPTAAVSVLVNDGLFTVRLGDTTVANMTALSAGLFQLADLHLRIWFDDGVNGSAALSPTQPLSAAPYAMYASEVEAVNMGSIINPAFVGTTNNEPLEFSVNNQPALRMESTGNTPNLVGGYAGNGVGSSYGAIIAGGGSSGGVNTIGDSSPFTVIGGGRYNSIRDNSGYGAIVGGYGNDLFGNTDYSSIGGGYNNNIEENSRYATIAGGSYNDIRTNSDYSAIGGGYNNNIAANASYATIPGGYYNSATDRAFAAGSHAKANHMGSFVWADSTTSDFASIKNNEFAVRASGGIRLIGSPTNSSLMVAPSETSSEDNSEILLAEDHDGTFGMLLRYDGGVNRLDIIGKSGTTTYTNVSFARSSASVGINTINPSFNLHVNGSAGKPGGGSWAVASDARLKKNIQPLRGVLDKLLQLHGVRFEYKDPEKIHELPGERMGLIAQEVEPVFPDWVETGPDGMKRLTVRGFEALTIEALRQLRQEKDAHITALERDVSELRRLVEALTRQLDGRVK